MSLRRDHDEHSFFSDIKHEDIDDLNHKKNIRRRLEERLERKRLKEDLEDELDAEFDWDNFEP